MAKRKSVAEESFKAIPLFTVAVVYIYTNSLPLTMTAAIGTAVIIVLLVLSLALCRKQRLRRLVISEVDGMSGREFELYLCELFQMEGYAAEVTPVAGDYGADLILKRDERTIAVQGKQYQKNVGIKAVQEVKAAELHYKAGESWVVTNSFLQILLLNWRNQTGYGL